MAKPKRPLAAAGSESKTAAGCSSDELSQGDLKSLRARPPQTESKPQAVSTSLSVAGMVLSFALGWGGRGMRPDDATQESGAPDAWEHTTHPGMREGFNWTQLSMSRAGNFPPTFVRHLSVEEIEQRGAFSVWHRTYARSIPAIISGLARNWSTRMSAWTRHRMAANGTATAESSTLYCRNAPLLPTHATSTTAASAGFCQDVPRRSSDGAGRRGEEERRFVLARIFSFPSPANGDGAAVDGPTMPRI